MQVSAHLPWKHPTQSPEPRGDQQTQQTQANSSVRQDGTRTYRHSPPGLPHAGNGVVAQTEAEFAGPSEVSNHFFPDSVHVSEELKMFSGHSLQTGNGGPR